MIGLTREKNVERVRVSLHFCCLAGSQLQPVRRVVLGSVPRLARRSLVCQAAQPGDRDVIARAVAAPASEAAPASAPATGKRDDSGFGVFQLNYDIENVRLPEGKKTLRSSPRSLGLSITVAGSAFLVCLGFQIHHRSDE
jgi:hypothetical protein